jgi:hypothetical protein
MAYRDDLAASLGRVASLERALDAAKIERAELDEARTQLREAEREVEALRCKLGLSARSGRSTVVATIATALVVLPIACVGWNGLINWIDPWGTSIFPGFSVGLAVGAAAGGCIGLVGHFVGRWRALLIWFVLGAVAGGFLGAFLRLFAGIAGG